PFLHFAYLKSILGKSEGAYRFLVPTSESVPEMRCDCRLACTLEAALSVPSRCRLLTPPHPVQELRSDGQLHPRHDSATSSFRASARPHCPRSSRMSPPCTGDGPIPWAPQCRPQSAPSRVPFPIPGRASSLFGSCPSPAWLHHLP